jgi:hypothetical protein
MLFLYIYFGAEAWNLGGYVLMFTLILVAATVGVNQATPFLSTWLIEVEHRCLPERHGTSRPSSTGDATDPR